MSYFGCCVTFPKAAYSYKVTPDTSLVFEVSLISEKCQKYYYNSYCVLFLLFLMSFLLLFRAHEIMGACKRIYKVSVQQMNNHIVFAKYSKLIIKIAGFSKFYLDISFLGRGIRGLHCEASSTYPQYLFVIWID